MSINLNSKCRTCLSESSVYYQLFDDVEENFKILEMLDCIVPQINVKSTSQFSTLVCQMCVEKLLIGYKFQQLCLESNERLRDLLGLAVIGADHKFEMMEDSVLKHEIEEDICTESVQSEIDIGPRNLLEFPLMKTHQKLKMIADPLTVDMAVAVKTEIEEGVCTESTLSKEKMTVNYKCSEIVTNPSICQYVSFPDAELKLEDSTEEFIDIPHNDLEKLTNCPKRFEEKTSLSDHYNAQKNKKVFENKRKPSVSDFQIVLEPTRKSKIIIKEEFNVGTQLYNENPDDNSNKLAIKFAGAKEAESLDSTATGSGSIQRRSNRSCSKYVFDCKVCGKIFDRPSNLQRHNLVHSPTRPYECEICKYRFSDAKTLKFHLLHHKGEGAQKKTRRRTKSYKCEACHRSYVTMAQLDKHFEAQHPEVELFKCDYCSRKCILHDSLVKHIRHRHKSDSSLVCQICKKVFENAGSLTRHILIHNTYLCPQCGKTFRSPGSLREHVERHKGLQKFQCPDCPRRFNIRSDKAKHVLTHSNAKPYVCDVCGSRFTRNYSMLRHKMLHTAERSYKCVHCNMTFKIIGILKRHMLTHTGEKPYKCKYCDRAYALNGDLTKHLRTHVGENIYMCDQCPLAFKYQAELRQHLSEHYKMAQKLQQDAQEISDEKTSN